MRIITQNGYHLRLILREKKIKYFKFNLNLGRWCLNFGQGGGGNFPASGVKKKGKNSEPGF